MEEDVVVKHILESGETMFKLRSWQDSQQIWGVTIWGLDAQHLAKER